MELFCESTMRGYHAYMNKRKVGIGEIMFCEIECDNKHDDNAVAVKTKDDEIVGHVPEELSSLFYKFLENHGEIAFTIPTNCENVYTVFDQLLK